MPCAVRSLLGANGTTLHARPQGAAGPAWGGVGSPVESGHVVVIVDGPGSTASVAHAFMARMSEAAAAPTRRRPPWALYPKLVSVCALLGGFLCVLALIADATLADQAAWRRLLDAISPLFLLVIVPASFTTVVFSVVVFWPRRRELLRERWMQAKLILIVATLPALHLLARGTFQGMRREVDAGSPDGPTGLLDLFTLQVVASAAVLLVAIWLGRYRPGSRA